MKSSLPDQSEVDAKERNLRGQVQDDHRSGRATLLPVFLSLAVAGAIVAILVFRVSPWTVAIGAVAVLCPLLHLGGRGGHSGHGTSSLQSEGRNKGEHDSHRGC